MPVELSGKETFTKNGKPLRIIKLVAVHRENPAVLTHIGLQEVVRLPRMDDRKEPEFFRRPRRNGAENFRRAIIRGAIDKKNFVAETGHVGHRSLDETLLVANEDHADDPGRPGGGLRTAHDFSFFPASTQSHPRSRSTLINSPKRAIRRRTTSSS